MSAPNHAVYVHLDKDGEPLYVGVTRQGRYRRIGHGTSPWFAEIAEIRYLDAGLDRVKAEGLERRMIRAIAPKHNKQHNGSAKGEPGMTRVEALALFGPEDPTESPPKPPMSDMDNLISLIRGLELLVYLRIKEMLNKGYTEEEIAGAICDAFPDGLILPNAP